MTPFGSLECSAQSGLLLLDRLEGCALFSSSILYFVYARYGGKEKLSLFVPLEITLLLIQVPLLFPVSLPFVLFVFSLALFLDNTVFFLLLRPLAHGMQSLSTGSLISAVVISLFPCGGRKEQPLFGGEGSVHGDKGVFLILNSCTTI